MTRNRFIKKWLGNIEKLYTEQNIDEMHEDLGKVVDFENNMSTDIIEHINSVERMSFDECWDKYVLSGLIPFYREAGKFVKNPHYNPQEKPYIDFDTIM